jgi:hypothetical protein
MIDNELKIEKQEGQSYPALPEDVYQVEFYDINSKMKPKYRKPDEMEQVFEIQVVVLDEGEYRARNLWDNFIPTYLYISQKYGKNKLYQLIESLRGKELTEAEEAEGITGGLLNDLVGKQCRVVVELVKKGDKEYNKITKFMKATKQLTPLTDEEKANCKVNKSKKFEEDSKEEMPDVSSIPF